MALAKLHLYFFCQSSQDMRAGWCHTCNMKAPSCGWVGHIVDKLYPVMVFDISDISWLILD